MARVVIALGGNALVRKGQRGTYSEQARNADQMVARLAPILRKHRCIITHGNAPQVGELFLHERLPLYACVAMTQAELGFLFQSALEKRGFDAATVITQVVVSPKDAAFKHPTKPIGPFYKRKRAGTVFMKGRGWRKVVASPQPLRIVEESEIKKLFNSGFTVIACGGGGVPVVQKHNKLAPVEAVIDKDLAGQLLAKTVKADIFLILTDVPCVYLNYGTKKQKPMRALCLREAKRLLPAFEEGSMKPKIQAAVDFLQQGGKKVIITSGEFVNAAMKGKAGTVIAHG